MVNVDERAAIERAAIEPKTSHLVVGGALGACQMHLTPQHGFQSVCHSVSFHYTTSLVMAAGNRFMAGWCCG